MVSVFLSHSWKKLSRSRSFGKELGTTIFLGIITLMLIGYALALGFALNLIITKALKISDSVSFLNGMLFYYLGFEFVLRYFMQNIPALDAQPYFHLPVKKSTIVNYLLGRSVLHPLNLFVPVLFGPFAFQAVAPAHGAEAAWTWFLSLWLCSFAVHFINVLFKKRLDDSVWGLLIIIGVFSLFVGSDYFGWFSMSQISSAVFQNFIDVPVFILIPFLLVILLYLVNYRFYIQSLYIEEIAVIRESSGYKFSGELGFLKGLGIVGDWINIEVKLILRNKRPRSLLMLSLFFLFYGLIFYTNEKYAKLPGFYLFIGVFVTGAFMISYGQFLFSWQGGHFDFTMTQPISVRQYIESKYYLLSATSVANFLLTIPYLYFGWHIIFFHFAACLFNIGVSIFIMMNMAMWDPKKIDLSKASTFNYEGTGAAQWLMGLPIMAGPYVFYLPFSFAGYPTLGIVAVGLAGLLGIAFNKTLLKLTAQRLSEKKYAIAAGFRKE